MRCASSPTAMLSGISTSRTTGAVGRSKPCCESPLTDTERRLEFRLALGGRSCRRLDVQFLAAVARVSVFVFAVLALVLAPRRPSRRCSARASRARCAPSAASGRGGTGSARFGASRGLSSSAWASGFSSSASARFLFARRLASAASSASRARASRRWRCALLRPAPRAFSSSRWRCRSSFFASCSFCACSSSTSRLT